MYSSETVKVSVSEQGVEGELVFDLLRDVIMLEDACVPVYGVAVSFADRAGGLAFERVHNVTSCREDMLALIGKMASGLVFPVSLVDIVEDFIA